MALQFNVFSIPAQDPGSGIDAMNRFLRSVKVADIHREFVDCGINSFMVFIVEYIAGSEAAEKTAPGNSRKEAVDYKEVLGPEEFEVFARLRAWRKEKANALGKPVYTLFNNEQLARMVTDRMTTKSALKQIPGVGDGRTEMFGDEVLGILKAAFTQSEPAAEEAAGRHKVIWFGGR